MASAGNTQSIKRIIDYTNSTGTPGDVLSTTVNGLEWVASGGGGVGTLQQVCTTGNTTNTSIVMTGKIDIETDVNTNPVSIGYQAGYTNQGQYSIAIGNKAGYTSQAASSIILNADTNQLDSTTSGFFVNPVRNLFQNNYTGYDAITKEITYWSPITFNGTPSGTTPDFYCPNCFNSSFTNYTVTIQANSNVAIAITESSTPTTIASVFTFISVVSSAAGTTVVNQPIGANPIVIGGDNGDNNIITCTLYNPYNPLYAFVAQASNITTVSGSDGLRTTNGSAYYSGFTGDTLYINSPVNISGAKITISGFN